MYQKKGEFIVFEQYDHKGKERINNPPVGLVTPELDKDAGKKQYAYHRSRRCSRPFEIPGN